MLSEAGKDYEKGCAHSNPGTPGKITLDENLEGLLKLYTNKNKKQAEKAGQRLQVGLHSDKTSLPSQDKLYMKN